MVDYFSSIDVDAAAGAVDNAAGAVDKMLNDTAISLDDKERELDKMASIVESLASAVALAQASFRASRNALASRATRLSPEAITTVMSFLNNIVHRMASSQVCRRWREASNNPRVWSDISIEVLASEAWPLPKHHEETGEHCYLDLGERAAIFSTVPLLAPLLERTASAPVHLSINVNAHFDDALDGRDAVEARERICKAVASMADGSDAKRLVGELFYDETGAVEDILHHVSRAANRIASLNLTVCFCPNWLLLLPCLPPMTALKTLVISADTEEGEVLRLPENLWQIMAAADEPVLQVAFPALETLKVSGMPGNTSESDSRLRIHRSRALSLLASLPSLKTLDLSLINWPMVKPDDNSSGSGEGDSDEPVRADLRNLKNIRLCSEGVHSELDCVAFDQLMDLLPINPGCSLRCETQGNISSYDALFTALSFEDFRPTEVTISQRECHYKRFESAIYAVDDDGNARSVVSNNAQVDSWRRDAPKFSQFRWTGRILQPSLDTGILRTVKVDVSAWNVLAEGFFAPALETLVFVLSAASIAAVGEKFLPRSMHVPKLRAVVFEAGAAKTGEPIKSHVAMLAGLLRAVYEPSAGKIQKVVISAEIKVIPESETDSLMNFCESIVHQDETFPFSNACVSVTHCLWFIFCYCATQ